MGTPVTDYTGVIQEMAQNGSLPNKWADGTEGMKTSVAAASTLNPDQEGEAQRLAAQTGVGPEIARSNIDAVRHQARMQELQQRQLELTSPILARQLSDPNFAAIAHDQLDNLSETGSIFSQAKEMLKGGLRVVGESGGSLSGLGYAMATSPSGVELSNQASQGEADYELGMLGIKAKRGQATQDDWARIRQLQEQRQTSQQPDTPIGKMFGGVASMAGNLLPMVPHSLAVGLAGAGVGTAASAITGPGAVAGAFAGFGTGFESEFGAQSYEMMAGNTYLDLLNKGVDENRAQWAAGLVGAANTALQLGIMRVAGKPVAGFVDSLAQKAMGDTIAEAMTKPTVAKAVQSAILNWGKNTAIGSGEMGLQTVVSRVGEDWAKKYDAGEISHDIFSEEFGKELGHSLVDAALTMGTINAGTGMIGFNADMARAAKAEQTAKFFNDLSSNAEAAKVRERNPEAYQNFVEGQAEGTGAENIYVDGKAMADVLHQSGLEPEQVEKVLPGFGDKINEAAATGGDVVIPTSQFATTLAGTDFGNALMPHMRLDPDGMSAAEAEQFNTTQKEVFEQAKQEAEQRMAANDDFAKSAKVVEGNIFDQLKATKTMPDDMARTNAQFVRDFVVTQAARANMKPEAFFDKYRYTISRAAGGEDALHQAAPEGTRGGFDPSSLTTMLGEKADMSTFLHETSHYFLSVYADLAKEGAPEVKGDFDTLLKWFGVKDADTWNSMSLEEQRKFHEQFAYSYEQYLAEGKAPSIEAQGVFDRFTSWLKRVYKSIRDDTNTIYRQQHGEDLPILTGEVRDVMDRMLASDEQIKQAEAIRNMEPVFKSQEVSGMDDAQWKAYGEMSQTATSTASDELGRASLREMQWTSTAKGRLLKAMQAQHESIRQDMRQDVRSDLIQQDSIYSAQNFLKTGQLWRDGKSEVIDVHKMDTEAARNLLPDGADKDVLRGMTKKGGLHPDEVAAIMGFEDGKALLKAIAEAPALKDAVDRQVDQRMLDRYGEMSTPEGMAREVEKATHNEARARLIAFELRHAFNMTEPERILVKAARETARKMLADEKFADINPQAYAAREAKAARQAQAAAARGDVEAVGKAKRDQLLQNALTSEALKVKDESQKHLRYLNKFDNPSAAVTKAIGADHMDAINELLAGYGLAPRERYSDRSDSMANWINQQYDRTGVMPAVASALVDRLGTMHWKDMTIQQLRDLRDAVKSIDYTGRRQTEITLGGKKATVDEIVSQVRDTLAGMKHTPVTDIRADLKHAKGLNKISANFLALKSWIRSKDAALIKMEQFFQWIDAGKDAGVKEATIEGPMQRVFHLASNAEGKERAMRAEAAATMRNLGDKLRGSKVDLNEALDIPELPRDGSTRWYREELVSMALNMGNDSNKAKLLAGYGWTEMEAVSAINRLLSKPEMDFIQGVWDHVGSYGKEIVELERRQTGVTPEMIEATPLATKHGVYPGGYFPVVYNDVLDYRAEENQARNADRLFENNFSQPATASGHTIARNSYVGPIYLSLGVIARHLDQVTHDLSWREPIIDMNKVLSDKDLRREIDQVYGREYTKQFRPWLQAMANDKVFNTTGDSAWESSVRKLRSNATMVGIGFRLSTMAVHGTSALSNSLAELGPKWFAKGTAQFMGPDRIQATRDFVYERSPEMAHRMDEADRNVHEAIDEINRQQLSLTGASAVSRLYSDARKFAFRGVGMLDLASAMPTWMGAYLKAMSKEADGGLNLGENEAIEYANRSVRNAHGGGGTKDMSAIQRDKGIISLATMFYSYWNHVYNRQRDLGMGWKKTVTGQASVHDFPKLLARSTFYIVMPQIAHSLLSSHQPDDKSLEGYLEQMGEGIAMGFVSGVPVLRDIANSAVHGGDYAISPLENAVNTGLKTLKDANKIVHGETPSKRAFQNAAETAGYAFGLPLSQPAASAKFLWNVIDGDVHPKDVADWYKGILTGKIK